MITHQIDRMTKIAVDHLSQHEQTTKPYPFLQSISQAFRAGQSNHRLLIL